MREQLHQQLTQLRLRGMAAALDAELERAEREGAPPAEVIGRLLAAEEAQRRERSLAYRLTQAKLPWRWTLDSFPFDRQPGVDRAQIRALAGLDFLRRNENIVLIGPPGTGKTGIALALLRETCLNGHAARFYNAQVLLDELYASLADRSTPKLLAQLARFQPLLIDELGYLTLKSEQSNAFFRLMDQRHALARHLIVVVRPLELQRQRVARECAVGGEPPVVVTAAGGTVLDASDEGGRPQLGAPPGTRLHVAHVAHVQPLAFAERVGCGVVATSKE